MSRRIVSAIMLTLLLVSMLTLAFNIQPVKAEPTTIYVDDDNTIGPWDGTTEHPYQNITSGLEYAVDGDTLFVLSGDYYENILIDKPLSLVGEDKLTTTIDANNTARWAIMISQTNNVNVSGFTVRNGHRAFTDSGIGMQYADHCNVSGNRFFHLFEGVSLDSVLIHYSNCIISENYFEDINSGIICVGNNNTISKNIITGVGGAGLGAGIKVIDATNNVISDNNITQVSLENYCAIILEGRVSSSNSNIVSGNYIANSLSGIGLTGAFKNIVIGNTITDCHWDGGGAGILLGFPYLGGVLADENIIVGNNITKCDKGIDLREATKNVISHNYLVNNAINGRECYDDTHNQWDDGYPSGGNYWGEYTGVDHYRGQCQNELGSDGIGDTPYYVPGWIGYYGIDRYPLMKPYGGIHDVGITTLTPSKTVVGQGYNLNITVTLLNYGIYTENRNITIYANTTVIATLTNITLTSRNSTTLTFTWNTTDFAKGKYTIKAVADTVPGEIDIEDNTFTDGTVRVAMKGDVTDEFSVVDIFDIAYVAIAFGAKRMPNGTYWHVPPYGPCPTCPHNPNADIIEDGIIDIFDIAIVAVHFGEKDS